MATVTAASAFSELYQTQYEPMVRLAYVTTGSLSLAEELVQDAFAEVLRRFDTIDHPVVYLRRAVVSHCVSWVRRRVVERRHAHVIAGWHAGTEPAPSPEAAAVRAALSRLRHRQRAAVFLRYYLDLPEAAIAQAMGCRPGTVKSMLNRALTTMREHLE
jgi:RNA polymerase sigma factor (sigma-70 family)